MIKNQNSLQSDTLSSSSQLTALVVSYSSLLGFYLTLALIEKGISVYLVNLDSTSPVLPLNSSYVHQSNNQDFLDQTTIQPDYICLLYPSYASGPQLARLLNNLSSFTGKYLVVDSFTSDFFEQRKIDVLPTSHLRKVYLTHPYGDLRFTDSLDPVQQILHKSYIGAKLNLANQGQSLLFPTHIKDLTSPLLKILFSSGSLHPLYWLSTLDQITELDFSYQAQDLAQEIFEKKLTIDFSLESKSLPIPDRSAIAHTQALLNWNPTIDSRQGTRLTFENKNGFKPLVIEESSSSSSPALDNHSKLQMQQIFKKKINHFRQIIKRTRQSRQPIKWLTLVFFTSLVILLPPGLAFLHAFQGGKELSAAVQELEAGNTLKARQKAQSSQTNLSYSRQLLNFIDNFYFFLPKTTLKKHDKLLDSGQRLSDIILTSSQAVDEAQALYQVIIGNQKQDLNNLVPSLKANLTLLHTQLALVETSLHGLIFSSRLPYLDPLNKTKEKLPDLRQRLELGISLLDLFPTALNTQTPKNYLLLLQNNTELRPTGGFITAFAILTFQNGQLVNYSVTDTYTTDAKLPGRVDPPTPLKEHLEANWFVRDANWFPNFTQSSKQVQWFLQKEINQSFDGVLAIDLDGLKSLLDATGPIIVTSSNSNQTVSSETLFQLANQKSQIDFNSPDATGQDFLTKVLSSLISQIRSGQPPLAKLAKALDISLKQQSLLLALNDPNLQNLIETNNWSGSLKHIPCPSQFIDVNCISETFALIEANLGINRSNFYLKRQISHQVNLDNQGKLQHDIDIYYQNLSQGNEWPGGKYKTYSRFYAPLNTQVVQVTLDNQPLKFEVLPSTTNPNLIEVGFYYEIPSSNNSILNIKLNSASSLPTFSPLSALTINWERQPGSGITPLRVQIHYPSYLKPSLLSSPAATETDTITFSSAFSNDSLFAVKFMHVTAP